MNQTRKVDVLRDLDGNKIVFIHDIRFKGKRSIEWKDVEEYLREFVGEVYTIEDTEDMVYIGSDLPDEYAHSIYTKRLKGGSAKAKANLVQGLPELIEIAVGKRYSENSKEKHKWDAKYGWYRYDSKFALPIFDENGEIEIYNVFCAVLLVRHAQEGKMYLYDILNIKKETRKLFQSEDLTQ